MVLKLFLPLLISCSVFATQQELAYVKTDSPRDTMETFIEAMNDYRAGVISNDYAKMARIQDAIRCFADSSNTVLTTRRDKELAAIFLKEAIDRVIVVDYSKIPVDPSLSRWRLRHTEIILLPQEAGERRGEWLITEGTWRRAKSFYDRVRKQPYLEGSGKGAAYVQPWMDAYLPKWSKQETLTLKNWQWLGLIAGLIFGLVIRVFVSLLLSLYSSLSLVQKIPWKSELLSQLDSPFSLLMTSLFWYFWTLYLQLEDMAYNIVNGIVQILFGIALTWFAYLIVNAVGAYAMSKAEKTESTLDDQLVPLLQKTLKLFVVLLGFLLILQNMGVNVLSLLAGLGLGGLAFALAAKDTAANLFGSIMILIDQPFKIGDWVKVGDLEGTVEEIGFRSTRVRTFYNSVVTVPNANVANAHIDNMGVRQYRRTTATLGVTYDTSAEDLQKFVEGIRTIIHENRITRKDYYHVYFSGYGDSSLNILIYFFLVTSDWGEELAERQKIYFEIFHLAKKLGVEFAFPTQTLHIRSGEVATESNPLP